MMVNKYTTTEPLWVGRELGNEAFPLVGIALYLWDRVPNPIMMEFMVFYDPTIVGWEVWPIAYSSCEQLHNPS